MNGKDSRTGKPSGGLSGDLIGLNWNDINLQESMNQIFSSPLFMDDRLRLRHVTLIQRHGARTTGWALPPHFDDELRRKVAQNPALQFVKLECVEKFPSNQPRDCGSEIGSLTTLGASQLEKIGRQLREFYVEKLHFLPSDLDTSRLSLFCTRILRTRQSLMYLMSKLYPESKTQMPPITETLDMFILPRPDCPRLRELTAQYRDNSSYFDFFWKEYSPILPDLAKQITDSPDIDPAILFDRYETFRRHSQHDQSFLPEKEFRLIERAATQGWFGAYSDPTYKDREESAKLAVARLLRRVSNNLEQATSPEHENLPQFHILAGHDTSISPFLSNYEVFEEGKRWPPFASAVLIELWETGNRKGETKNTSHQNGEEKGREQRIPPFLVRMIFNDRVMRLPGCASQAVENGTLCPLDRFLELSSYPTDLVVACGLAAASNLENGADSQQNQ